MQTQYSPTKFYGVWASNLLFFCTCFFNPVNALPLLFFYFLPKKSSILVTFPFSFYAYYSTCYSRISLWTPTRWGQALARTTLGRGLDDVTGYTVITWHELMWVASLTLNSTGTDSHLCHYAYVTSCLGEQNYHCGGDSWRGGLFMKLLKKWNPYSS